MQVGILSGICSILPNAIPDFGSWRPNILIVVTLLGVVVGFSWLGVHTPDKWMSAAVLYILGSELQLPDQTRLRNYYCFSSNILSNVLDVLDGCVSFASAMFLL